MRIVPFAPRILRLGATSINQHWVRPPSRERLSFTPSASPWRNRHILLHALAGVKSVARMLSRYRAGRQALPV